MNSYERMIYDKYAYKKPYIYLVYEEFERRVNATPEEYEGLKTGECRFDYDSWEKRLGMTRYKMQSSIKALVDENVLKRKFQGQKNVSVSIFYLCRFDNKQDNNQNNNQNHNCKDSNINVLDSSNNNQNNNQSNNQNLNTSIYNNPNIISNNINSSSKDENKTTKKKKSSTKSKDFKFKSKDHEEAFKEIWSLYPKKKGIAKARECINKLLDKISKDELIRCVERYKAECIEKNIEEQFIKYGSTFFGGDYEDYLDINYSKPSSSTTKSKPTGSDNFDW